MLFICMLTTISVFSQWPTRRDLHYYYSGGKWNDNIYLSIGGGGLLTLAAQNLKGGAGEVTKPYFYLKAGKLINPFWGFRGAVTIGSSSERGADGTVATADFVSLHGDMTCNLVNAFGGYKRNVHPVDVYVFAGPYINMPFGGICHPGISLGGLVKFNISEYFAIDLEARFDRQCSVVFPEFDRFYCATTLGISYTFGGKKF